MRVTKRNALGDDNSAGCMQLVSGSERAAAHL